ncbi:hypothetical protein V1478_008822, partial [Vespula squamosa]
MGETRSAILTIPSLVLEDKHQCQQRYHTIVSTPMPYVLVGSRDGGKAVEQTKQRIDRLRADSTGSKWNARLQQRRLVYSSRPLGWMNPRTLITVSANRSPSHCDRAIVDTGTDASNHHCKTISQSTVSEYYMIFPANPNKISIKSLKKSCRINSLRIDYWHLTISDFDREKLSRLTTRRV